MKRKLEKPEVKIVKLQRMDVIATSGDDDTPKSNGVYAKGLSKMGISTSYGFSNKLQ